MSRRPLAVAALAALLVVGCIGGPSSTPGGDNGVDLTASFVPLAAMPMAAPTIIDVASTMVSDTVVTPAGAMISTADGAGLNIPTDGVGTDTRVVITRLDAPYRMNVYAAPVADDIGAIPLSRAYDFGPAGVSFTKPATVTLPYDPIYVPEGSDTQQIGVAYYDGTRWLTVPGKVDPVAHTVSVTTQGFSGTILTTILITLVIGIPVVPRVVKWIWGGEGTKADPISEKIVQTYVTPDDPAVIRAASGATVKGAPLSDKVALEKYMKDHPKDNVPVLLPGPDGTPTDIGFLFDDKSKGANWQKPADYFSSAPTGTTFDGEPAKGGMHGDCTSVTSAMVSVFRSLGYRAKGVFGYQVDTKHPHAWGEVLIGDTPYLIDENGKIQQLDGAMIAVHFIRPAADDPRAFMWDEDGQEPYQAAWWSVPLATPATNDPGRWGITINASAPVGSGGKICMAEINLTFNPSGGDPTGSDAYNAGAYMTAACPADTFNIINAGGSFDGHTFALRDGVTTYTGTFDGVDVTITDGNFAYVFPIKDIRRLE